MQVIAKSAEVNSVMLHCYYCDKKKLHLKRDTLSSVKFLACCAFLFVCFGIASTRLYGIEKKLTLPKIEVEGDMAYIEIGEDRLSLSDAMKLVIFKNLTLRKSMYELVLLDTQLLKFQKKYDIKLGLEGKFASLKKPAANSLLLATQGDTTTQYDVIGSIRKKFSTGTEIIGGISNLNFFDVNDKGFQGGPGFVSPANPGFYRHGFFVQIKQELLKNFLGRTDRASEKALETRANIGRSSLVNQLADILVKTIGDYWNVTITKKALETRLLELSSVRKVRQIIIRNSRLGISEKFDINRYNSLVATAESKFAKAKNQYEEAQRTLIRQIDLPPDTKITGVTDLSENLPQNMKLSQSIETAFQKRVDYKNLLLEMKALKFEKEVNENSALPSLLLDFKLQTASQADNLRDSLVQAHRYDSPSFDVSLKMDYPLFGKEVYTNARNSELKLRQQKIAIEEFKKELRDDVINKHQNVILAHTVLQKSKIAEKESQIYYTGIFRRSKQGKFNSESVKSALDGMINSRLQYLQDLVNYNLALLQYDLSKNEIFDRYNLDIEDLLKQVKL